MALTGIQIFKFLPAAKKDEHSNCKVCGCPTCMAYAMKAAKGDIDINKCPYIDDELKDKINQENRKPQAKIEFGSNEMIASLGGENVMFRHDKTFVTPTTISVSLSSEDVNFDKKLRDILSYKVNRVGQDYTIDAITILDDGDNFVSKSKTLFDTGYPVILITKDINKINSMLEPVKKNRPLIYLTTQDLQELRILSSYAPVIVDGTNIEELSDKAEFMLSFGCKNIVLNLIETITTNSVENMTAIRRSAIEHKFEPLGFPIMKSYKLTGNVSFDTIVLTSFICKYANLLIIDKLDAAILSALITLRLNIYTDPQKPLQVEPKLYEIGDVSSDSPVVVTTNFALTYFAVVNELEGLNKGTYLIITDSDGMSVLTAWSASKFTEEIIANAIKKSGIKDKIKHNNVIIPGLVSDLKDDLQLALPEFNIIVGTNDATDLPDFLVNL